MDMNSQIFIGGVMLSSTDVYTIEPDYHRTISQIQNNSTETLKVTLSESVNRHFSDVTALKFFNILPNSMWSPPAIPTTGIHISHDGTNAHVSVLTNSEMTKNTKSTVMSTVWDDSTDFNQIGRQVWPS